MKSPFCFVPMILLTVCVRSQVTSCTNLIHPYYSSGQILKISNPGLNYARPDYVNYDVSYLSDSLINKSCATETSCTNGNADLYYDVYYPDIAYSDVNKLPVFVMFHAGGFSDCSNPQSGAEDICTQFAQRGYVAFNVEYRRGRIEDTQKKFTSASHWLSFYRAVQDSKGAIRTIVARENAKSQLFRIDTSKIFIGGSSSGADVALMIAYFTEDMMVKLFSGVQDVLGPSNVDGYAGNVPYSIKGVLDMWGGFPVPMAYAAKPSAFIKLNPDIPPFIAFHGNSDDEVNIASADMFFSEGSDYASESLCTGNKIFTLPANGKQSADLNMLGSQGLYDIIKTKFGIKAELYIDCDMRHGLEEGLSDFGLGDTVKNKKIQTYMVQRAATFFQYLTNSSFPDKITVTRFVDCENLRSGCKGDKNACSNTASCPAALQNAVAINHVVDSHDQANLFNITQSGKTVVIHVLNAGAANGRLYNMNGTLIKSQKTPGNSIVFNCSAVPAGIYIVQLMQGAKMQNQKIVLQ